LPWPIGPHKGQSRRTDVFIVVNNALRRGHGSAANTPDAQRHAGRAWTAWRSYASSLVQEKANPPVLRGVALAA
jgi:hypothetical protein